MPHELLIDHDRRRLTLAATDPVTVASMYASLGEFMAAQAVSVYADIEAAERWLSAQTLKTD